jgi:hypothetical protein
MRTNIISRLSGTIAAAALAITTLAAVGVASPAHAAATCSSTTSLRVSATTIQYGGYASLSSEVKVGTCAGGTDTYVGSGAGAVYLERSVDGRTWTTLKAGDYPSYVALYGTGVISASGWYRARYTGGTESTTYEPSTFTGSVSQPVKIDVIRAITTKDKSGRGKVVGKFRITPVAGLAGKKLTFQVKKGAKWKKYKKVKVPGNGSFKVTFKGSRKGIKYRLIVPAASGLSGYVYGPYTARSTRY